MDGTYPIADSPMHTATAPLTWEHIEPLQSHLFHWVRSTDRRFARSLDRLLQEIGIIASEWSALRELYRPQCWSPVELGAAIGMSRGGGSKLISRLVAKGLVFKKTPDFDRRFRSIGLTSQGRQLVVSLAPFIRDTDREFFGALGNNRRYWLQKWLNKLLKADRIHHMPQWIALQLRKECFPRVDAEAAAKEAAEKQAKADELWNYCLRVANANALGLPAPPWRPS